MSKGVSIIAVYDVTVEDTDIESVLTVCREVGFDVEDDQIRDPENKYYSVPVSYGSKSTTLSFNQSDDREPGEPLFSFGRMVYPEKDTVSVDDNLEEIEALFELICRFATELRAGYIALFDSEGRRSAVVPKDRPIADAIDRPPRLGVYSDAVLSELGGIEGLFETPPWYVAELGDGRTLVIESESPWKGWRPPTDAPYIEQAWFNETDTDGEQTTDESLNLSDPFAVLSPGEYGIDACITREDIGGKFRNDELRTVRVYVDDDWNLRRVEDDTFVRNVVFEAGGDEQAVIKGMLADIPPDADDEKLMISALLHGAVPPSFVRLDAPDGENVVSRVLELDIKTNKVELLVSLGEAAQHGEELDTQTIESALDNLADLGDTEAADAYVRENLL